MCGPEAARSGARVGPPFRRSAVRHFDAHQPAAPPPPQRRRAQSSRRARRAAVAEPREKNPKTATLVYGLGRPRAAWIAPSAEERKERRLFSCWCDGGDGSVAGGLRAGVPGRRGGRRGRRGDAAADAVPAGALRPGAPPGVRAPHPLPGYRCAPAVPGKLFQGLEYALSFT